MSLGRPGPPKRAAAAPSGLIPPARWAGRALALVAALVLIAGCGSSSGSGGSGLTISPAKPHASSDITFSFTAPTRAGIVGKVIDSYSLSVTGPAGANCKGSDERTGSPVAKGATERISLGPAQLGANWCVGPYTARVFEIQRPYCKPGVLCPQYVHVAGVVVETSFAITS
jgi:hypothetical protein